MCEIYRAVHVHVHIRIHDRYRSWPCGSGSEEQVGQLTAMKFKMYKGICRRMVKIAGDASSCMYIHLVVA